MTSPQDPGNPANTDPEATSAEAAEAAAAEAASADGAVDEAAEAQGGRLTACVLKPASDSQT